MKKPQISKDACVLDGARVVGDVTVGDGSSIWHNAVLRGDLCPITVGERTNIQDCCVLHGDADGECRLGDNVTIGHACVIHQCCIQNGAFIGMGSIVMNNSVIGEGSIVGAGSLVTSGTQIPPGSLAFGRPAKVVRSLTEEEISHNISHAAMYSALARSHQTTAK